MCGRFTLLTPAPLVADTFQLPAAPPLEPRCNVAPTQPVFAVRRPAGAAAREGVFLRWGLIPSWARDPAIGHKLLNARAETVADKPSFRTALQRRRCLIPADGFYEWQTIGGKKQPIRFRRADGALFAFAGLWERGTGPEGGPVETCTIVTTAANDTVRPIHDRMPVILPPAVYDEWLDPTLTDATRLGRLMQPWTASPMRAEPANPWLNNPRNEGPACLLPA